MSNQILSYTQDTATQRARFIKQGVYNGLATLLEIPQGEFFRWAVSDTSPVYIRGDYCPTSKKFSTVKFTDANCEVMKNGATLVYIGFTF